MKPIINYEDFAKLDLRVGKIIKCEAKEKSEKLLRLTVDFGEEGIRSILSGISNWYGISELEGKKFIFILNLMPRQIMGENSEGMILAAASGTTTEEMEPKPVLLIPLEDIVSGATIS